MDINFNLIAEPQCGIAIDSSSTQYVENDSLLLYEKGNFSKDLSVVLNILRKRIKPEEQGIQIQEQDIQINDDSELLDCELIDHDDLTEVTHHKFKQGDGIYEIYHFVIPTERWYTNVYTSEVDGVDQFQHKYTNVIYYKDGNFYKVSEDIEEQIFINDILALKDEDTSLMYASSITLCTCQLHKCYFNLSMHLMQLGPCNPQIYNDLIYKRDMAWMGINVINYLLDEGNPMEAEIILQKLEGCNGVCINEHKRFRNCGCHK